MGSKLPQVGCHTVPFCIVSPSHTVTVTSVPTTSRCCSKQLDLSVYSAPSTSGRQGLSCPHSVDETWKTRALSEPRCSGFLCVLLCIISRSLWWPLSLCPCALSTEGQTEALACPGVWGRDAVELSGPQVRLATDLAPAHTCTAGARAAGVGRWPGLSAAHRWNICM